MQGILLTCNIQKHLCWNHFYNLLATFTFFRTKLGFLFTIITTSVSGGFQNFETYFEILPKSLRISVCSSLKVKEFLILSEQMK